MHIKSVTRLQTPQHFVESEHCDHVTIKHLPDREIPSLCWPYETSFKGPQAMAKRNGGWWDWIAKEWKFPDAKSAYKALDSIRKRHPDWPILGDPDKPYLALAGVEISRVDLGRGLEGFLVPLPLPRFTRIPANLEAYVLESGSGNREHDLGLLISSSADANTIGGLLGSQGAVLNDRLSKKVQFELNSKVQVSVFDWPVHLQCDVTNPHHYCLIPATSDWSRRFNGFVSQWHGVVHTTLKKWPDWKAKLASNKIEWEGDDPEQAACEPVEFDASLVPGWLTPAPNGYFLHAYQKDGVRFCLARGMRALIGDEMGIGKTAQAIAAAEATGAQRIVIFCPASARYVWEREIQGWSGRGEIQHIKTQFDKPDAGCRWHIVTYDLLPVRPFSWTFQDEQEERAFLKLYPQLQDQIKDSKQGKRKCRKLPAALLQAEDRIHRVGQKSNCQVIQLIAKIPPELFNLDDMMVDLLGSKRALIGAVLEEDTENIVAAGMKAALQHRLLSCWQPHTTDPPVRSSPPNTMTEQTPEKSLTSSSEQAGPTPRKRGRPRKYSDAFPPPSATERSKRSTTTLIARGGKRVMLRLRSEANTALAEIMALTGSDQTTAMINQAIIEWHRQLKNAASKKP